MNRDEPAFAIEGAGETTWDGDLGTFRQFVGLTKREYAAVHSDHHEVNTVMVILGWNNDTYAHDYVRHVAMAKIMKDHAGQRFIRRT